MRRLNKRDKVRIKNERPVGILHVRKTDPIPGVTRYWPSPDLEPFVEHYWVVRWDVTESQVAETVPIPSVHLVLEPDRSVVYGVMRARFSRRLSGRGRVLGTRFRPGAFRRFVDSSVSWLTNRQLAVPEVFGPESATLGERALRHDDDRRAIAVVERFLRTLRPTVDEAMIHAARIVSRIATDREVTRVSPLAQEFGVSQRALQRLFRDYVGVSPKWVIQRYRLLEAAGRVAGGQVVDWADLALELGFADQAHFIREFKKLVGRSPAEYSRSLERRRGHNSRGGRGGSPWIGGD